MDIFFTLFTNLLPLYILIAAGYAAARFFEIDRQSLANLCIFIFLPVVAFGFVLNLEFQPEYILLPFIFYAIQAFVGLIMLRAGRRIYDGPMANILAMTTSMGNTGYFGLPLALMLFPPEWVAVYIFTMLGGNVYEATLGYYIAARGRFDRRESIRRLLRFPTLYAITLALAVKYSGLEMPALFDTYWAYFKGAYVVAGMMIIGAALAKVQRIVIGPRFLSLSFVGKFLLWPLTAYLLIWLDGRFFQLFEPRIYDILMVMSLVPPAANVAAFAAQLNLEPEKAATTVLFGTLFALFYIPAVLWLFGLTGALTGG